MKETEIIPTPEEWVGVRDGAACSCASHSRCGQAIIDIAIRALKVAIVPVTSRKHSTCQIFKTGLKIES